MEFFTMKTKEELNKLKDEFEALNKKLAELTDEELMQVTGGGHPDYTWTDKDRDSIYRGPSFS